MNESFLFRPAQRVEGLTHYLLIRGAMSACHFCWGLALRSQLWITQVNHRWVRAASEPIFAKNHFDTSSNVKLFSRQVRPWLGSRPHADGRFPRDRRNPRHCWVSGHRQRLGHPRLEKEIWNWWQQFWAILNELKAILMTKVSGQYPQKKLLVLLEELRTYKDRFSLK